jgi:uncharacterized membrane protein
MDTAFSIEESLRFGWKKTKEHSFVLFQVLLTLFALRVVQAVIEKSLVHTAIGGLANLLLTIVFIVLGTGFIVITLKIAKGEKTEYRDIVPPAKLVLMVFLASVLVGVLTFAGLILLVIPGIYFALRFSMIRFAIIEGAGVMESFERSTKLTDGQKWPLLGFLIVAAIANIIGAILLVVGLLITIPVTMIAFAHIYLKLKAHADHAPAHAHDHSHEGHEHHDHSHGHNHDEHDHTGHSHEENK